MNYYIYHIPGIKIGCTSDLEKRMSDQGFTHWDILETHTDIYEVSDREIQLQKDYGLPVDTIPYWKSVENRLLATEAGHTPEAKAKRSTSLLGNTNGMGNKGVTKSDTSNMKAPKSEYHKEKIRLGNTGKILTEETKTKISESIKANPKIQCPHCDKPPMDPRNFGKYHGHNCKHKKG